jgi:acylphosphatase
MPAKRLTITGHVQGVFFRANAQLKAQELGIGGWIRNEPDGTVAVVAEGEERAVERFIEWCWQGPPAAQVDKVKTADIAEEGLRSFRIEK